MTPVGSLSPTAGSSLDGPGQVLRPVNGKDVPKTPRVSVPKSNQRPSLDRAPGRGVNPRAMRDHLKKYSSRNYNPDSIGCYVRDSVYRYLQFLSADLDGSGMVDAVEVQRFLNLSQLASNDEESARAFTM